MGKPWTDCVPKVPENFVFQLDPEFQRLLDEYVEAAHRTWDRDEEEMMARACALFEYASRKHNEGR